MWLTLLVKALVQRSYLAVFIQSTSNTMVRGCTQRFCAARVHRKCYHRHRSHDITIQRSSANIRRSQRGGRTSHSHTDSGWGGSRAGAEDRWGLKNHSCARKVGHRIVGLDGRHCSRRPVLTVAHSWWGKRWNKRMIYSCNFFRSLKQMPSF